MILFMNQFLSYLIIALVSMGLIVLADFLGKKWREAKDAKDARKEADVQKTAESEEA